MVYGSVYSLRESALNYVEPYEFDDSISFTEMGAIAVAESTEDWNRMMRAIALTELSYVAEAGQELIYESVDIEAIKNKVVKWFQNLWAKIQGIAKTALAKFASFGKNDESFIDKYSKDIYTGEDNIPDGFSFKGYKFHENLKSLSDDVKSEYEKITNRVPNKIKVVSGYKKSADSSTTGSSVINKFLSESDTTFSDLESSFRASICGHGSGKVSASDFGKELDKYFRGSSAKVFINKNGIDAKNLISIVSGAKDAIDAAEDARDTAKDTIDESIDKVDEAADSFNDTPEDSTDAEAVKLQSAKSRYFTKYSGYLKNIESAVSIWFSHYISALKDQNRQAKAICVKLVGFANGVGGKKDLTKNEAASILEDRFATIFD
jgi:hypothetical protein